MPLLAHWLSGTLAHFSVPARTSDDGTPQLKIANKRFYLMPINHIAAVIVGYAALIALGVEFKIIARAGGEG